MWIVKSLGCHCTDSCGGKEYHRVPTPVRSTSPLYDLWAPRWAASTAAAPGAARCPGRRPGGGARARRRSAFLFVLCIVMLFMCLSVICSMSALRLSGRAGGRSAAAPTRRERDRAHAWPRDDSAMELISTDDYMTTACAEPQLRHGARQRLEIRARSRRERR